MAFVAFAWRYVSGERRKDIERRVREAAGAAWLVVVSATDLPPHELFARARVRALALLAKLGIRADDRIARLVEHELEMLAVAHATSILPDLDPDHFDQRMADAAARGRARVGGIAEHVQRIEPAP